MANDTPYLLRMEMLKMAQQRASEKFQNEWGQAAHNAGIYSQPLTEVPEYPSTEHLLHEARQLKDFVDKG